MQNFKEIDEIEEEIKKMKKLDPNQFIKFEKNIIGYKPNSANLDSKNENKENLNNLQTLIDESCPLAILLYSSVSDKLKENNIPLNKIEVNILVDCARIISNDIKYYNMLIVCGLSVALHTLEIPFSLSLIGDKDFKIMIKKVDDNYDEKYLQQMLDCIFIHRYKTKYASCLNYAINNFKPEDINLNKEYLLISGGIDSELKLVKSWGKYIFNNPKNSFGFIFIPSKNISKENINYLINDIWNPFKKGEYISKVNLVLLEPGDYNKESLNPLVDMFSDLLIRKEDEKKEIKLLFSKPIDFYSTNKQLNLNILRSYINCEELQKFKDYYINQQELPQINIKKMEIPDIKYYSNIQGKIINSYLWGKKSELHEFSREFKISKEKLNLSYLETIFKPNLPTQYILTSRGSKIDIHQLIFYFLNPTPNPLIYREIEGGYVKNYGITVIFDNSISCLTQIQSLHTIQTIRVFLSTLATLDIPCFDFIVTGNPQPLILCSEKNPLEALKEKSDLWSYIFASILCPNQKADLLSALKVAYDLNSLRKTEYKNYIFVLTDGLYSKEDQNNIKELVGYIELKEIDIFGIGLGVNPNGITNLFSKCIYSLNPYNLFFAINRFFIESNNNQESIIPKLYQNLKFSINDGLIKMLINNPIYKKLKNELNQLQVTLESLYFYNVEQIIENPELGKTIPIRAQNMYKENLLKGQKILIVMLWTNEMNPNEKLFVNEKYIFNPYKEGDSCIKQALDYYGIEIKIVKNYEDAIKELCKLDEEYFNCCPYYACWIMCGPPYPILPDKDSNPYLIGQFIDVLNIFWEHGGAVVLLTENDPFTYQANLFLEKIKFEDNERKINFRISGNHKGGKILKGNNEGNLREFCTFNKKINTFDRYQRASIAHNLKEIYEGITISYAVKKNYIAANENEVEPFIPFSKDSEGGINSLFYCGKNGKGDIVIDCSYTKFLTEMSSEGTARYIQNIACWTANSEFHYYQGKKPNEFRPKAINYKIDYNKKWDSFIEIKGNLINSKQLKTLFVFDFSGSVSSYSFFNPQRKMLFYHEKIKMILDEYYNLDRGDKIYIWNSNYKNLTLNEIDKIIKEGFGEGGTKSSLIAEIGNLEKKNNFKHLLITTDGKVSSSEIDLSDKLMNKYNIKYEYVTTYIIGKNGNLSVGAPYCRNCPNITIYCKDKKHEEKIASLTEEEIKMNEKIELIKTKFEFDILFGKIKNYIRAQTLGTVGNEELKKKLNVLKIKMSLKLKGNNLNDFLVKWNELYKMAEGSMRNALDITVAS